MLLEGATHERFGAPTDGEVWRKTAVCGCHAFHGPASRLRARSSRPSLKVSNSPVPQRGTDAVATGGPAAVERRAGESIGCARGSCPRGRRTRRPRWGVCATKGASWSNRSA